VDVKYVESLNGNFVEIQYVTPELLLNLKEEIAQIRIDGKKDELLGFNNAIQLLEGYGVNTEDLKNRDFEYVKKELNTLYTDQKNKETQKILAGLNKNYNIDVKTFDIKEIDPVLGEAFYQNILNDLYGPQY
jgi:DNA repair ATPase RecN